MTIVKKYYSAVYGAKVARLRSEIAPFVSQNPLIWPTKSYFLWQNNDVKVNVC